MNKIKAKEVICCMGRSEKKRGGGKTSSIEPGKKVNPFSKALNRICKDQAFNSTVGCITGTWAIVAA